MSAISKHFPSKIDFIAFSFFAVVSTTLAIIAYLLGGVDFGVYYAAGRVFLQGGNPYAYSELILEIVSSTGDTNNPYYYAPWFTWLLSAIAIFPYEVARILWAILNYALWVLCLFNLSKLIPWPMVGWQRWGIYLYLSFVFAWATWGSEQVGIFIFLILTFILLSFQNEKWVEMGIWMALLLFKPNITAIPITVLSIWLILHGRWQPIVSAFVFLICMLGVSLIVSPMWYVELLQTDKVIGLSYTLNETGEVEIERFTTTLLDWLSAYRIAEYWSYRIYAAVILGSIFFIWRLIYYSQSLIQIVAAAVLINFALVPYALFYDYPSLSLTFVYTNAGFVKKPQFAWVQWLMNGLIFASLFIGRDIRYRYWMVVILLAVSTIFSVFTKDNEG